MDSALDPDDCRMTSTSNWPLWLRSRKFDILRFSTFHSHFLVFVKVLETVNAELELECRLDQGLLGIGSCHGIWFGASANDPASEP